MTHHDDDRHQLIPNTATGPREDVSANPHPTDVCQCSHQRAEHPKLNRHCDKIACPCFGFKASDVLPSVGAREARYAEALHQALWDVRDARVHALGSYNAAKAMAGPVMAVADAELAELRAKVEALGDDAYVWGGEPNGWLIKSSALRAVLEGGR